MGDFFFAKIRITDRLHQFALFLLVILVFSIIDIVIFEENLYLQLQYITNFVIMILSTVFLIVANHYLIHNNRIHATHITLSAIVLFLIVHPTTQWWIYPILLATAVLGKMYFRYKKSFIFNPAAFGILCTFILTSFFAFSGYIREPLLISWWGGEIYKELFQINVFLSIIPVLILGGHIYFMKKYNRLWYAGVFFIVYLLLFAVGSIVDVTRGVDLFLLMYYLAFSSLVFISFVMIAEPHTSPKSRQHQIILGFFGGALGYVLTLYLPGLLSPSTNWTIPTPLILTVLILNILTHIFNKHRLLK